jgi:metal-dependent HD superfamily phosphatase/phosphodiesterase
MVQGQPYNHNDHVNMTYNCFCKEPHINLFLCHWNFNNIQRISYNDYKEDCIKMGMAYVQVLVEVINECFIDLFLFNQII